MYNVAHDCILLVTPTIQQAVNLACAVLFAPAVSGRLAP
eukprot:COSAG02_NODE_54245_length_297_cov_0.772727_1_plen_38_part_10